MTDQSNVDPAPAAGTVATEILTVVRGLEQRLINVETQLATSKGVPSFLTQMAENLEQKAFDVLNARLQSLNIEGIIQQEIGKLNLGGLLQQQFGKIDLASKLQGELTNLFHKQTA